MRRDGIAKVLGTIICIGGAITVSLYKGIVIIQTNKLHSMNLLQLEADQYTQPFRNLATIYGLSGPLVEYKINNYHLGIICLLFNTFSWAVFLTLQVVYLSKYLSQNLLKPLSLFKYSIIAFIFSQSCKTINIKFSQVLHSFLKVSIGCECRCQFCKSFQHQ